MTLAYLLLAAIAASGFYLASPHQRLWAGGRNHVRGLRACASGCAALAMAAAIAELGLWAGVFASLTMAMLALVVLPYLDAWRQLRAEWQR